MISVLVVLLVAPQDLFERDTALRRSLAPGLEVSRPGSRKFSLELDAGADFACGSFDLGASFRSIFDRNVGEELLGGALQSLQSELAQSPLVLACYASPTVCDAIKHYRSSTTSMLGMELDGCRALEDALPDVERRAAARAVRECLDRQARAGVTLDRARQACRNAGRIRGLDGRPVAEIDLRRDLGIESELVSDFRMGPGTVRAEATASAVIEAFEKRRKAVRERWEQAVRDPSNASLDGLGPVSRREVHEVALLDAASRASVIRSIVAVVALAQLLAEAHRVERALEAAELTASPEVRPELERRRRLLRNEMARLEEAREMEGKVNDAVERAAAEATSNVARRARARLAERRAGQAAETSREKLKPWGCEVHRKKGGRCAEE